MKKTLKTIAVLLVAQLAQAQNPVKIADLIIPQNGQGELIVQYEFPSDGMYTGYSMSLSLPDGISLVKSDKGKYIYTLGNCHEDTHQLTVNYDETKKVFSIGCLSLESDPLSGTSGILLTLPVEAEGSLTVGSILQGTAQEINFGKLDGQTDFFTDVVEFDITIGEPADTRTVLDENSTTVPAAATDVDVRVKRTIKANEWSTICLPFAMTEAQVKEAFGNDVLLGDFAGAESEFDEADNVTGIAVSFDEASAIEANHPYVIKASQPVEEFTVDGVNIVADEDEAYIEFDNGKSGSRRVVYSGFYGTYHAQTVLDEFTLFLYDNKFWYSTGQTKMKAFRAYFAFLDVLTDVENAAGVIEFKMNLDDATGIRTIDHSSLTNDHYYNLAGQRVGRNYKGIVVTKGKKALR